MQIDPNAFGRGLNQSYGFVTGIANDVRQGQQQNALSAYAQNPDDPNALNALARNGDPRIAMQLRQQQQQAQAAKQEQDTKMIAALARDAKDPAQFDSAVDQVVAMGYPEAAQFKGKFSPALRSALMASGGLKDDEPQRPQLVPYTQGGGVAAYDPQTRSLQTLVMPNPGDKQTGAPVQGGGSGAIPQAAADMLRQNPNLAADFDAKYGPGASTQVLGGQSQPATGGFLDPLSPR